MTSKEYLQEKYEWHKKHWNEHEHIDDNWWANEMEEYHQAKLKLLGIADVSQQRELLLAYEEYCDKMNKMYENKRPKVLLIDSFLSQ